MKKIMLMAAAFSFNGLFAQEQFDDNESEKQEIEVIGAAENAADVGPSDVAAEPEEKKQQQDVAQFGNDDSENNHENDSEE